MRAAKELGRRGSLDLFDRVAGTYDRVGPAFFSHFAGLLAERAELRQGERVLDLATGGGAVLAAAADRAGDSDELVGVDTSEGMLLEASKALEKRGLRQVRLERMDARRLGFPDRSFDHVLCGFAITLIDDPPAVLDEAFRVLCPGGRLGTSAWAADCPYFSWLFEALDSCQRQLVVKPARAPSGTDTAEGLRRLFARTGFEAVDVGVVEEGFVYRDRGQWWRSLWTYCFRPILERFDPATLKRVKRELLRRSAELERDGHIRVDLRAIFASGRRPLEAGG